MLYYIYYDMLSIMPELSQPRLDSLDSSTYRAIGDLDGLAAIAEQVLVLLEPTAQDSGWRAWALDTLRAGDEMRIGDRRIVGGGVIKLWMRQNATLPDVPDLTGRTNALYVVNDQPADVPVVEALQRAVETVNNYEASE